MQETQEIQVPSLGQEDPLEEGMTTYSSIHAWKTSWTEEPDGLHFMGFRGSDTTERLSMHTLLSGGVHTRTRHHQTNCYKG